MRPRPATRTALFVDVPLALSLPNAVRCVSKPHSGTNARFSTQPANHRSAAMRPQTPPAAIAQADGSVLPVRRTSARPQRPSIPNRHDACSGNPPAVHPREPPETPALPQSNSALKTSHACTGGTLLHEQKLRNRKPMLGCAQTVEDGTSLWKPQEKRKTIRRHS